MERLRSTRRWIGWVAVVAILANVVAAFVAHALPAPERALGPERFDKGAICFGSPTGVPHSGDGDLPRPDRHCPDCVLAAGVPLHDPSSCSTGVRFATAHKAARPVHMDPPLDRASGPNLGSRAPPHHPV